MGDEPQPAVLVIVLAYGRQFIHDCLASLTKSEIPANGREILVVVNPSNDTPTEEIRRQWSAVRVIENSTNLGFAAGNNVGIRYAIDHGFRYVYLLNQDTEVEPDFLSPLVALAEADPTIGAVQSKLMLFGKPSTLNSVGNHIHYLGFGYAGGHGTADTVQGSREITYPSGAGVLLRLSSLEKIGLLNEELFMYHEDLDLGWRLWLAGYRVLLEPASVVYHKYEFSRSRTKMYFMERNRRLVMLQNYKVATLLVIFPAWLLMDLALLGYSFLAGWGKEELRAVGYFFSPIHWSRIFKTRQQVQRLRTTPDRQIIKRFVGRIEFQDIRNPLLTYVVNPLANAYWQLVRRLVWW